MPLVGLPRVAHADLGDEPSSKIVATTGPGRGRRQAQGPVAARQEAGRRGRASRSRRRRPAVLREVAVLGDRGRGAWSARSRLIFGGHHTPTPSNGGDVRPCAWTSRAAASGRATDAPPVCWLLAARVRVAGAAGCSEYHYYDIDVTFDTASGQLRRDQRDLDDPGVRDDGQRRGQRRLPDRPERRTACRWSRAATWASSSTRPSPTPAS